MKAHFFWLRDRFGRWAIDRAGEESGSYTAREIRRMLDNGTVTPHTWLRHSWTRRYSLVGEMLFSNGLCTEEEFDAWFPNRSQRNDSSAPPVRPKPIP